MEISTYQFAIISLTCQSCNNTLCIVYSRVGDDTCIYVASNQVSMSDQQCVIVVGTTPISYSLYHFIFITIHEYKLIISQPDDISRWRVACQTFNGTKWAIVGITPVSILYTV